MPQDWFRPMVASGISLKLGYLSRIVSNGGLRGLNIGDKIGKMRENAGFSMRKVAKLAGISPSLVSQIESGKVNPSLNTLRKLAMALDTPLFHFVVEKEQLYQAVVKEHERREVIFPDAGLTYQIVHSSPQKKMGIHIGLLKPGGATSEDLLFHEGEECIVIIEGRMEVLIGESSFNLTHGDSIYFDSSAPHRLTNPGPEDCRFWLIITPPKF